MVLFIFSIFLSYAFGVVLMVRAITFKSGHCTKNKLIYYNSYNYKVCELGQKISDAFDGIDIELESFAWYLYPYELQRILPTFLIVAQVKCAFKINTIMTRE